MNKAHENPIPKFQGKVRQNSTTPKQINYSEQPPTKQPQISLKNQPKKEKMIMKIRVQVKDICII